jgi:hypothetical protein
MQQPIEKYIIISLLGILLGLFPSDLIASETAANPGLESQPELYELLFGINMALFGLVAVAVALYRWKVNDLSLISFGVFCIIWGVRTEAFEYLMGGSPVVWAYGRWSLTYLAPVPVWVFLEQIIGKGWKSSIRRLLQLQIVFVMAAVSADFAARAPGTAMMANNYMAIFGILVAGLNMFRPGLAKTRELTVIKYGGGIWAGLALYENVASLLTPGHKILSLEPFGFFAFIGCLVYSVVYRFFQNEKDLITIARELETARQIQSFILPQKTVAIRGLHLAAHYVPMASVAGDFYDFIKMDDKRMGILVADVSGHGVPASLISSMVKIALSSQLPRAHDPAAVLSGVNQILCGKLESDFVTAGYLFIDTENNTATYAGAGHPPLLLWRGSEQKLYEYRQKGIILGQFADAGYQNIELGLVSGDRFLLYTDGVIEATNAAGDLFGWRRFKEYIASHANQPAGDFADRFIRHITGWSGKHLDDALDDDLTLVVAEFKNS